MLDLSPRQYQDFKMTTACHICQRPFTKDDEIQDHCHLTAKYRGPAHNSCNLKYQNSHTIPVVFHNLSGYDAHVFIKTLATAVKGTINILPVNKERYISFTKYVAGTCVNLRFIDSFRFMASSLDKLATYLNDDNKTIIKQYFSDPIQFSLLCRKGVFPYEYVNSLEKLDEKALPSESHFYSKLTDEDISDNAYRHALNVWNELNIRTLGEYSDLYLVTDVLLLADIFENSRHNCLSTYALDALHYYTVPGLAFDAMLKCTGVNLELLTEPEMILFIEKGIQGGSS